MSKISDITELPFARETTDSHAAVANHNITEPGARENGNISSVSICIERSASTVDLTWKWTANGAHLGRCIAVLEAVKHGLHEGFTAVPLTVGEDSGVCIAVKDSDQLEIKVRGLSYIETLEGLLDVQYQMQKVWFTGG